MSVRVFTFAVAVAFLISTAYSVNNDLQSNSLRTVFSCTNDNQCSNQGKCDSSGTCSCFSGYGNSNNGYDCAVAPSATCSSSYTSIFTDGASFSPSLTVNVNNSVLSIGVSAPLESTQFVNSWDSSSSLKNVSTVAYSLDTSISFGSTSFCNYPPLPSSSVWTKTAAAAGTCMDQYQFSLTWSDAKTRCGFTYDSVTKSWVQQVTMTRHYSVPYETSVVEERRSITRTETIVQLVRIVFPDLVDVSTDITVSAPLAISSTALSSVTFLPSQEVWEIDVMVLTAKPYKLASPTASVSGIDSGRLASARTVISDQGACNSNSASCTQKISVFISQCSAITGQVVINLNAVCSGGADAINCVDVAGQITITANLNTDSSCDRLNNITLNTKSLTPYATADFDSSVSSFYAQDTVYFGASINSSDAVIQTRTILSVCFILDPLSGDDECVPFDYITLTSHNPAIEPAFSVNLDQTRLMTNETETQVFAVRVTFGITWDDPSSLRRSEGNTARVQSVALIQVTQSNIVDNAADSSSNDHSNSDHKWKVVTIAAASAGAAIIVGIIVVASLVYRKRLQVREAERSFNFSQLE